MWTLRLIEAGDGLRTPGRKTGGKGVSNFSQLWFTSTDTGMEPIKGS